jgi:hypothetical protein
MPALERFHAFAHRAEDDIEPERGGNLVSPEAAMS